MRAVLAGLVLRGPERPAIHRATARGTDRRDAGLAEESAQPGRQETPPAPRLYAWPEPDRKAPRSERTPQRGWVCMASEQSFAPAGVDPVTRLDDLDRDGLPGMASLGHADSGQHVVEDSIRR
jgi:hypothetical protein